MILQAPRATLHDLRALPASFKVARQQRDQAEAVHAHVERLWHAAESTILSRHIKQASARVDQLAQISSEAELALQEARRSSHAVASAVVSAKRDHAAARHKATLAVDHEASAAGMFCTPLPLPPRAQHLANRCMPSAVSQPSCKQQSVNANAPCHVANGNKLE